MPVFEMIKYHKKQYPSSIPLHTEEIACNFDTKFLVPKMDYSLHTEYSYTKRANSNPFIGHYDRIVNANKFGIPMLWFDKQWAKDFALFLIEITSEIRAPKYIEIHPPYSDYTEDIEIFLERYSIFEEYILSTYPQTNILIENRCGSLYKGGKFIISDINSLYDLVDRIVRRKLNLRITIDIPQLYTGHNTTKKNSHLITELLIKVSGIRDFIDGVHLWGKKTNEFGKRIAHIGDLNTYFYHDMHLKNEFLKNLYSLFDDNKIRNMVLEVNSGNNDLNSIVMDLIRNQFAFI